MKKKKLTDEELEELDSYLNCEFNHDIYAELTANDEWNFELFSPLEFFRMFYSQIHFIETDKAKPLFVVRSLENLSLSGDQFDFLYEKIIDFFSDVRAEDEQIEVCCREISRLKENLEEEPEEVEKTESSETLESYIKNKFYIEMLEDIEENPTLFDCEPLEFFQTLKKANLFISNSREKPLAIKEFLKNGFPNRTYFLIKLEEDLERDINHYDVAPNNLYLHQISDMSDNSHAQLREASQIVRKERLKAEKNEPLAIELQKENANAKAVDSKNENDSKGEMIKHKGLNRESAFLFFEYLFEYANVKCDKKKKAETIEHLTGYSHKKIVPLFSWFEKEKLYIEDTTEIKEKFSKDMNFVRECFEMLGLTEIIEKLDTDLGN
ncbi:MAG TPA: hypothetical protein PKE69_01775 [Pyrinomonadaceae bacterium]|nr:hypothetical protein [Pyrinomonadaceae bacterium]